MDNLSRYLISRLLLFCFFLSSGYLLSFSCFGSAPMPNNASPALKSCKILRRSGGEENDKLSELPDEILLSIMSRLTMKEAAKTSIFSHKWKKLWEYYPGILNFEDSRTKEEQRSAYIRSEVSQNTCNFVRWVTHVVEHHFGPAVEEFRVTFPLDNTYQSDIDEWVIFALAKGAKSLVLDFDNSILTRRRIDTLYTLPLKCFIPLKSPCNLPSTKSSLKTLVLRHINITTEVLECFLLSCPFLEKLHIHRSVCLASIRASGSPLALKQLDVSACPELENVDILAPKLVTFRYNGQRIQLHIRNALLLSEVSVGGAIEDPIAYAFDSLSGYFSQLEYFNVVTKLFPKDFIYAHRVASNVEMNLHIPPVSKFTNLKHLRLTIHAKADQTLSGWFDLIESCPVLEKLALELSTLNELRGRQSVNGRGLLKQGWSSGRAGRLECLKTLELYGFVGRRIDFEFAIYVLENAEMLEQIIIDFKRYGCPVIYNWYIASSKLYASLLTQKLPRAAKLVLIE